MASYIVTVKLPKNPEHDPRNKKTGECDFSAECTDVTGEHHSFIAYGVSATQVIGHLGGYHITRIEKVWL
jgi:hypothetical protein